MATTKSKAAPKTETTEPNGRPVLVTTEYKGIFFGWSENTDGDTIKLTNARNCISWTSDIKGFLGLAATGPSSGCRIGAEAPSLEVRKVTAVADVSPAAVIAWGKA